MKIIPYILLSMLFLFACQTEDEDAEDLAIDFGYTYYPLRVGQEAVYEIDSILYDDFSGSIDTVHIQRLERVQKQDFDSQGQKRFEIGIYERSDSLASWKFQRLISRTSTERRVEQLQENILTIPFVFPIKDGRSWDANALNIFPEENYRYRNLYQSYLLEGQRYDSTLTLIQKQEFTFISQRESREVYAAGIGMIYREDLDVRKNSEQEITSGYEAKVRLASFVKGD